MCNIVIIVNNIVLYTWKLLRRTFSVLTIKKKWYLFDVMKVLTNAMVIIILQYISMSNQYIVHL